MPQSELVNITLYTVTVLQAAMAMLAVMFWFAWLKFGHKTHTLIWFFAFLIATLQWVMMTGDSQLFLYQPSEKVYWVVINALSLIFVSLLFLGHRQRGDLGTPISVLIGAAILVEAALVWYAFFGANEGLRFVITPLYAFILLGWSAISIIFRGPGRVAAEWLATLVTLLFALLLLATGWIFFEKGEIYQLYSELILYLALPLGFISLALFTFLLMASDLSKEINLQSITDQLTGTLNRRGMEEAMKPAYSRARRYEQPLAVVMTDIDYFKTINEDYGHITGDNALTIFAVTLRDELRIEDVIGRMGGEEFVMILPNTSSAEAKALIERLRHVVASTLISTNEYKFNMTASFGLTSLMETDEDIEDAIQRADKALDYAKMLGRNRVEVYQHPVDVAS